MRMSLVSAALTGLALVTACSNDLTRPAPAPSGPSALVTPGNISLSVRSPGPEPPANWCLVDYEVVSSKPFGVSVCVVTGWMDITTGPSYWKLMLLKNDTVAYDPWNGKSIAPESVGERFYISMDLPFLPTAGNWEVRLCETDALHETCDLRGSQTFTITQGVPAFKFDLSTLPAKTYGDPPFSVAGYVTTPSHGVLSFATGNGSVGCSVTTDGVVTLTGPATGTDACIIEASQGEAPNYLAAGPIGQSFHVAARSLTFTFDLSALPAQTFGDPGFDATAYVTSSSTGAVTFQTGSASVGCAVTPEGKVTFTGAATGTDRCVLLASLAADGSYPAAGPIEQGFGIARAPGSVSITNIPADASYLGSFTPVFARSGDGIASTTSSTPAICTVASGTVHFDNVGTCTLIAAVAEGSDYLAATASAQSFSIGPLSPAVGVRLGAPSSRQYSDLAPIMGWVSGPSGILPAATGTIQFSVDGIEVGGPQTVDNGIGRLAFVLSELGPGSHPVTASFTSTTPNLANATSAAFTLIVGPEDVRVTYTGPEFVATPGAGATSADVPLSATIQDITALPGDPAYDQWAGDIRNARVAFVNRDNGEVLCTELVPIPVDADDHRTGTVGCTASLSAGATGGTSYTIGIVVGGYYTRDSSDDNETVTVAQPINGMITGGGSLINSASAGPYAGAVGLKTNFGFNVKYNKNMNNLLGGVNVIVRGTDGKVYQIKSNATTSLTTRPNTGSASFISRANLVDITDPASPISLGGNLDLQVTMQDNGTPGALDLLAITLRTGSGALLFSSNWTGTVTAQQNLRGGDLVVR